MQQDSIDRIRSATFSVVRRGYEKREVDTYLTKLADWLEGGGADQAGRDTVRRELERIGQKTGKILTAAEDAARSIRADAEDAAAGVLEDARAEADSIRGGAERHSTKARADADSYAEKTRAAADTYANDERSAADARAEAVIEEGNKRRRDIEQVISDLERRRDAVLAALQKLSTELAGTATLHGTDEEPGGAGSTAEAASPPPGATVVSRPRPAAATEAAGSGKAATKAAGSSKGR